MTNYPGYSRYQKKPIRKDRVLIVALFVVAAILVPILLRSGCTRRDDPITVTDAGADTTAGDQTPILPVIDDVGTDGVTDDGTLPSTDGTTGSDSILADGVVSHTVEDGETMADVAAALGVTVASLRASNRLYGSEALQPGQVLVASTQGILHEIKEGQTLTDISLSYGTPVATLTAANGITPSTTIYAGDKILIPGAASTFWDNVVALSNGEPSTYIWPLTGEVVSVFGWREHPVEGFRHHHDGIDIDVPEGTIVHATAGGEVFFQGEQPGYGTTLILKHPDNFYSIYGHLSNVFVYVGQFVEAGQGVAQSGNTGLSSGPHLHFELRNGDFPINPERYLP